MIKYTPSLFNFVYGIANKKNPDVPPKITEYKGWNGVHFENGRVYAASPYVGVAINCDDYPKEYEGLTLTEDFKETKKKHPYKILDVKSVKPLGKEIIIDFNRWDKLVEKAKKRHKSVWSKAHGEIESCELVMLEEGIYVRWRAFDQFVKVMKKLKTNKATYQKDNWVKCESKDGYGLCALVGNIEEDSIRNFESIIDYKTFI